MNKPAQRRLLIAGFAFFVVASGIAAATLTALNTRAEVDAWTAQKSEVVESVVQNLLDDVFNDLEAMAGYIEHGNPTTESFQAFSDRIDGTANSVGAGYVASIPAAQIDAHIAERRAELGDFYDIVGLSPDSALPVPFDRSGRKVFYPVQLFAAGEMIQPLLGDETSTSELGLGIDGGYTTAWRNLIGTAIAANDRNLSSFFAIEAEGFRFDRLFFASVPVRSSDGQAAGIVISVMLEPLLLNNVDTNILGDVQWEVVPVGGEPERISSEEIRFFNLDVPNTPWRLAVAPTDEALAELTGRPAWMNGLLVSVAAALVALSLWLLIDRRSERNRAAALRTVSAEKDRFLATVSHELRTPLTVVAGVASEIRDRPLDFTEDELESLHSMIVDETDELTAIVEDLLVAARSDIASVAVTEQPVDMKEETATAVRALGASAKISGDSGSALADPQRVRQILRNLLTNARRYGGDQIRVEVSRDGPWVNTVVADSGAGIPPSKRELVFEPYESAHNPGTETGSVGLGLYVSRALARAMNGELSYSHDGSWSNFELRLPATGTEPSQPDAPATSMAHTRH